MEIDVISEDENPMLHRTDVRFEVTHEDASPSRLSVRDSLAAKLNKDAGEVVGGRRVGAHHPPPTVGYAKVYDNAEVATEVEQEYMLDRNKIEDEEEETEEAEA